MLIVSILVFCIVLFVYLHVQFHLKRSNDLEVYEIDQPSKQRLEEVCDVRQPTTFEFHNEQLLTQLSYQSIHANYRAFDINIRDVSKTPKSAATTSDDTKHSDNEFVLYIPVALKIAHEVLKNDTEMKYVSENNSDFIEETGLIKTFQLNDDFLRPYMVSKCSYDIFMASTNTITPLRYDVNYRNYYLVTQGSIRIMLIPPKDVRYLHPIKDYDIFEFRSPVNPWKVQPEYQDDFDKIKTLEVELYQGMVIFIPAYWWYSIKFTGSETSVCSFKYRTYMNTLSISPEIAMSTLQHMNTKRDTHEKRVLVGKDEFTRKQLDSSIGRIPTPNVPNVPVKQSSVEYDPSIEEQYLPKSLRGNSSNPYSMMNSMSDQLKPSEVATIPPVLSTPTAVASAAPVTNGTEPAVAAAVNETVSPGTTTEPAPTLLAAIPVAEYTSNQKEVTI
jgi:hypothetical protein